MTTLVLWRASLEGLTPTGVVKTFAGGPPNSLNTVDLPAQWIENTHSENRPSYAGVEGGDRTLFADYVIAIEAVAQNNIAVNSLASDTMQDSVNTSLTALTSILMGPMTWRSRVAIVTVAGVAFWSVVTEIEGLG